MPEGLSPEELSEKEQTLKIQLEQIHALEQEIQKKEKSLKETEKAKKQVLLRLAPGLWNDIAAWAEADYRSINGQIEYLLNECVKARKKK